MGGGEFPGGLEAFEEADQHEDVKGETEPIAYQQEKESVEAVEDHPDDKAPGETFAGEEAEADEQAAGREVQSDTNCRAGAADLVGDGINDLSHAQSQDEAPVASRQGGQGIDQGEPGNPEEPCPGDWRGRIPGRRRRALDS